MQVSISVVIPACDAERHLTICLQALRNSLVAPFETILVDDGSIDATAKIATAFGAHVLQTSKRMGPAAARNLGVQKATGDVLFFLDSDVCVKPDTLQKIRERFEQDADLAAVIGSYDSSPSSPDFLSQYRNLMHAYVHQSGAERASTFWTGCGAIRRCVFLEHRGFSEDYRRPSIEDIELGYRLNRDKQKIILDSSIEVTHLKKWTFWNLLKTDILDRGIPWTQLILRDRTMPNDLNLQISQRVSVALVFILLGLSATLAFLGGVYLDVPLLAIVFLMLARWWGELGSYRRPKSALAILTCVIVLMAFTAYSHKMYGMIPPLVVIPVLLALRHRYNKREKLKEWHRWLGIVFICSSLVAAAIYLPAHRLILACFAVLLLLALLNSQFYIFLARKRGIAFMLAAIPFNLLYHFYNGLSFGIGVIRHSFAAVLRGTSSRTNAPPSESPPGSVPNALWGMQRWPAQAGYFAAAIVYAALTLLAIAVQYRSGAYGSDFSLDPDEPAHAVSSLMVRDYLAQSFPANPLAFARDFYAHYPKLAIGHWPPLFYCAEGVWMLAAGRSRIAMLLFVALCGGALLFSVYCTVRRRTSTAGGLMSAAILFCFPTFQQMLSAVRPDLLLALLTFWASLFCGRMVLSRRHSLGAFVALTLAALLVHGRGCMLLLLPICLFPFRERKAAWKWLVPVGVFLLLFSLPYLLQHRPYFAYTPQWRNIPFLLHAAVFGWGPILIPIAAIGVALAFRPGRYYRFWATMSASFMASCLFLVLLPFPVDHYFLITALPPLAALIGGGIETLWTGVARLWKDSGPAPETILFTLAVLIAGWKASHVAQKPDLGYHRIVADCLLCRGNIALVAGDAVNEGALIAEGSLADVYRARTILRGSKVLASSTWSDHNYRMLYATTQDVDRFLDRANVSLIVLQTGAGMKPHVDQLEDAITHNPAWVRVNVAPTVSNIAVYQRAHGYGP